VERAVWVEQIRSNWNSFHKHWQNYFNLHLLE